MEMSRREYVKPFQADHGSNIHQTKVSSIGIQPLLGRSWKPSAAYKHHQFPSMDSRVTKEIIASPSYNTRPRFRGPHPYKKNQLLQHAKSKTFTSNIPSLLATDIENGPRPLIPHETLEKLKTDLRYPANKQNNWIHEEKEDSRRLSSINESSNIDKYIKEEKDTKKKINEIIVVAQALREKLEREKEIKRISGLVGFTRDCNYDQDIPKSKTPPSTESIVIRPSRITQIISNSMSNSIPRLMDLKPKIPNLMDLCVTPPDMENVIQENIIVANNRHDVELGSPDKCWNSERPRKRYVTCKLPELMKSCFRCGRPEIDVSCCSYCKVIKSLKG